MTDRARPDLFALYDIRPGNGAGQFLQPRSQHGGRQSLIQFLISLNSVAVITVSVIIKHLSLICIC